jgi:hypothetical protein
MLTPATPSEAPAPSGAHEHLAEFRKELGDLGL